MPRHSYELLYLRESCEFVSLISFLLAYELCAFISKARIDGLTFQRENTEHTFMDPTQRFALNKSL